MGCQKNIARNIIDKQGDYVLALKGNQGLFAEEITEFLAVAPFDPQTTYSFDSDTECDKGHGRIEERTCYATSDISRLHDKKNGVV